jgi:hypothetical protein
MSGLHKPVATTMQLTFAHNMISPREFIRCSGRVRSNGATPVACLVESAQRGNQVGFRRRGSLSSVKRRHLFRPGKMVMQLFVCKPQEGGTENIHS